MQTSMILKACHDCGQPIRPGEPAWQSASVDIVDGRVVATPVRYSHMRGGCEAAMKRHKPVPRSG